MRKTTISLAKSEEFVRVVLPNDTSARIKMLRECFDTGELLAAASVHTEDDMSVAGKPLQFALEECGISPSVSEHVVRKVLEWVERSEYI